MDVLEMLAQRGAVLTDKHFVYKSKKHGPHYINMDPVFPDLMIVKDVCFELGKPFWPDVDTVAAAATGGIPLSVLTALGLGDQRHPYPAYVWADKVGDGFAFERAGFTSELTGRVLVVEDLLNTGDSVRKVVAQARKHGADIVGVSVICNRGNETAASLGVPRLEALATVRFQAFDAEKCPLCEAKTPIVLDIGHGAEFRRKHPGFEIEYTNLLAA